MGALWANRTRHSCSSSPSQPSPSRMHKTSKVLSNYVSFRSRFPAPHQSLTLSPSWHLSSNSNLQIHILPCSQHLLPKGSQSLRSYQSRPLLWSTQELMHVTPNRSQHFLDPDLQLIIITICWTFYHLNVVICVIPTVSLFRTKQALYLCLSLFIDIMATALWYTKIKDIFSDTFKCHLFFPMKWGLSCALQTIFVSPITCKSTLSKNKNGILVLSVMNSVFIAKFVNLGQI